MVKLFKSEWQKIWFSKSSKLYLLFSIFFSVLIGLVFAFTTELTQDKALAELNQISIIEVNMLGVDVLAILLIIFTAVQIGREFQGNTIQLYLTVTPKRFKYLTGKLLTFFLISSLMGFLVSIITLVNGQLILLAVHGETLLTHEVFKFVVGCTLMPIFYTLITVCASFMMRSTAFGIVIPGIVLFLPVITELLPFAMQKVVTPILPASVIHSISGRVYIGDLEYTSLFFSLIILIAWCILSIALTSWKFNQRDL